MQRLIRPTLFLAVKVCLFLGVTGYLVGQSGDSDWGVYKFRIFLTHTEWSFFSRNLTVIAHELRSDEYEVLMEIVETRGLSKSIVPALRITVSHWLIVSTFVVFYAILKFIYRRKPDGGESDA